jgi:hypothetical protein
MANQQVKKMSLTEFMSMSRTFWAGFGVFAVCLTIYGLFAGLMALLNAGPTPCVEVEPTFAFADGQQVALPQIIFPARTNVYPQSFSFSPTIQLASDDNGNIIWPRFGEPVLNSNNSLGVVNVYKLRPLNYTLNADQASRDIARKLNFPAIPKIIDSRTLLFSKSGAPLEENLQIDLKTMFLTLKTNALTTTNYFGTYNPDGTRLTPDRVDAIQATEAYLNTAGILPGDYTAAAAPVVYYRSVGAVMEPVESQYEADFVMVPLAHKSLPGIVNPLPLPGQCEVQDAPLRFFGPDNFASIRAWVGRNVNGVDMVVQLEDYYYDIDYSDVATYYLKPISNAWQELQAGNAYVLNPRELPNAVITSVELGYYESHTEQEYLLPIYVFIGENDFMAYVSAINASLVSAN